MITLTINGKEIKLEKSVTVLEAARSAGIKIPTLCYHEQLEKYGGCRLCLVEVQKMPRLQTACTLMAADGMVVRTETEQIADVRRGILEFLLINHPLDCPYCDKAGECELQDLVEKYGPAKGRFRERKRRVPESLDDPVIVRNMERCIMCTRCVRMCEGRQGASAISVISRGGHSHIEPFSGGKFDCEYCGNCVSVCPVGAIMSRLHRHSYRPWQVKEQYETVCPYCGVGCTVVVQVRDDVIKRVIPKLGSAVNNGMLCSRGRFGYEFVGSKDRLSVPMIRKNGVLAEATWEEAIRYVAEKLSQIKSSYGSDAIAGIASLRCSNEDNYVFQKFMRIVIGTNNIDTTARTGFAGAQAFIENIFGQGSTANIISGLSNADTIMVVGGDPTTVNPILGLQIRACGRRGGNILSIGRYEGLRNFDPTVLMPATFADTVLLEGIVTALKAVKGLSGANKPLEDKIKDISVSFAEVQQKTGVTGSELEAFVNLISKAETFSLVIGKDIVQSRGGSYKLLMLSAINYLANGRIYLLSERANEQGSIDMGCLPDMLPGCRPVSMPEFRHKYEAVWHAEIPELPGMNIFEIMDAADKGKIKALYVMGENPVCNLPDSLKTDAALEKLDFLVVQDIFMTETAKHADVVLPVLSWAEKDGTFTNMERRIQRVRKAVQREGMPDWKIISEIAKNMGYDMAYSKAEDVFNEIAKVSPLHRDLTYQDMEHGENIYPYKGEPLRDMREEITAERIDIDDAGNKFYLGIERPLFHSGTLSTHASAMLNIYPMPVVRMSKNTAEAASINAGDVVKITSEKGFIELPVVIDNFCAENLVRISNNFDGRNAFRLSGSLLDPVTKAPCLDRTEIKIEKVQP